MQTKHATRGDLSHQLCLWCSRKLGKPVLQFGLHGISDGSTSSRKAPVPHLVVRLHLTLHHLYSGRLH